MYLRKRKKEDDNWIVDLELELMDKYDYQVYLSTITYDKAEFDELNYLQTNFILNVAEDGVDLWNLEEVRKS